MNARTPPLKISGLPPGLRHHPISVHYQQRFGHKIYKISVSTAESCPNRSGRGGLEVCTFCDPWGSAAYEDTAALPLSEQISTNAARLRDRYKAEGFLVYFQAFTTTFGRAAQLAGWLEEALAQPGVEGLVVGTRPDCLPGPVLRVLADFAARTYLSVELGVQSLDDDQLGFLSRGHDAACSLEAMEKLVGLPGVNVCAHLMFGLPGETDGQLRQTARTLSRLGVDAVKLHNLHVLRHTPLERLYQNGQFVPVSLEAYAQKVRVFLEHLDTRVAVHRLSAVASRWEDVVAPDWVKEKMRPVQYILDHLEAGNTWQGRLAQGGPPEAAAEHEERPWA